QVYTTITGALQSVASRALRDALIAYERRQGYPGVEHRLDPLDEVDLRGLRTVGGLVPARVLLVEEDAAYAEGPDGRVHYLPWEALAWARPRQANGRAGPEPQRANEVLRPGDVIR